MKQTHYFTVNFTGFTTAASEEQSYLRLIAGEHAFYTDKRHFKDPSLFDRLRLGQPLHIGTCRLKGWQLLDPLVKRWPYFARTFPAAAGVLKSFFDLSAWSFLFA
ncbi:hypothetical protein LNP05_05015 [Klebsiella pneumoniae subsp. pneumoniae]|nr:hypothetical protein [Klebsiella pneumoniae subsp. pneumoniae]